MPHRRDFHPEEKELISSLLRQKIPKPQIAKRRGPGGKQLSYIEAFRAISGANEIFSFDGWSSEVTQLDCNYLDEADGRVSCGYTARVRVTLSSGANHEDVGYGTAENVFGKGAALEKASKEAVSDALKRALRLFGDALGNCLYDKDYVDDHTAAATGWVR